MSHTRWMSAVALSALIGGCLAPISNVDGGAPGGGAGGASGGGAGGGDVGGGSGGGGGIPTGGGVGGGAATALAPAQAAAQVVGGVTATSPNYKVIMTTTAPPAGGVEVSPQFKKRGGLVGATQGN